MFKSVVPLTPTVQSPEEQARTLVRGYQEEVGELPTVPLAELMLAQHWLETARGKKCFGWNWGNLSAGASWTGSVWRPNWFQVDSTSSAREKRLHQLMLEHKVPSAFRAYPDAVTGVRDYVALLHRDRFQPILDAGKAGDVEAFARAVNETGYCPDCAIGPTTKTLASLRDEIRAQGLFTDWAPGETVSGEAPPAPSHVAALRIENRILRGEVRHLKRLLEGK